MKSQQIMEQFPDWEQMKKGTWSKHPIILTYGRSTNEYIEIGLYREPESNIDYDGTYTLQGFNGDEVLFSVTVQ